jgi:hypothetical protein
MTELTNDDYKHILEFYKEVIPKSKRLLKLQAERLIANKLCRCIKKVYNQNEDRSIGICTKTVINNKGYTRGKFKFKCKGKPTIKLLKKNKKNKTQKK